MIVGSLRTSITAIAAAAVVLVASATVYLASAEYRALYRESAAATLDALSENLGSDLVPILADTPDLFEVTSVLLRLDQYRHVRFALVLDRDYRLITQYVGASITDSDSPDAEATQERLAALAAGARAMDTGVGREGQRLLAMKRVGDPALPLGYLLISTDLSRALGDSTARLLGSVIPLAVATIAIALVVLVPLLSRLFRPLQALQDFTRRVRSSQDYGLQAPVQGTHEVSDLTADFNSMLREINHEIEKNRRQNELLRIQRGQMEALANFDALTGLSNRQFVMQTLRLALASAKREERDFAVLFLDLDGFKAVNDNYGHDIGDRLLESVSERLRAQLRESDLVARLGGDEFLIVLDQQPDTDAAARTAQRLIAAIEEPQLIDRWRIRVGASIGIATAATAGYDLSELMIHADVAMYRSKQLGKGRHTLFLPSMAADEQRRLRIAAGIVPAIERDELALHYQPKVDTGGRVVGFEALLRWRSAELGPLPPDEFIPIAERSGHIQKLSRWVVTRACRDLRQLQAAVGSHIHIALNLSAHDLRDRTLPSEIGAIFHTQGVDPRRFELEITETAYLPNFEIATDILQELRALGCSITLDDFGTGFSSLGYLTRLKIDSLKIDRQFVENLAESERDRLLAGTIVEMAGQLGMSTVAEGVETAAQAQFLIDAGCDMLQGYFYARPLSLETIAAPDRPMPGVLIGGPQPA